MKKNLLLVVYFNIYNFLLIYFLLFIKTLEKNHKSEYLFKSRLGWEFHEKYSNILNHKEIQIKIGILMEIK